MSIDVFTIGHSTLSYEQFLHLLKQSNITAIVDVRSSPYSRWFPHFNREFLKNNLQEDNISYVFLGSELGGRPKDKSLYSLGVADYREMAKTDKFSEGLNRIINGANQYRICLMCSEKDPLDCHRCLLVGRALHELNIKIQHILQDGTIVTHEEIEIELLEMLRENHNESFESLDDELETAYRHRSVQVAWKI